jgi:hypothetical protein
VHAPDLVGQETERAFELAYSALEITDFSFNIHGHRKAQTTNRRIGASTEEPVSARIGAPPLQNKEAP